ncbi:MAG: pyridoxamine 5'-phosphate oxidase family protein [archaeon]|jgi:predicted pyridoxine 5'-phosphate oxidase superfamily flavin-nucleotide-binding protein
MSDLMTIKKIIENNDLAVATVDKQNKPNVVFVCCAKVISKNQIILTDNYMKKTKENILINKNISIAVSDTKLEKGYQLKGTVEYHSTGKWLKFVKDLKENKGFPAKGALVITIKEVIELA